MHTKMSTHNGKRKYDTDVFSEDGLKRLKHLKKCLNHGSKLFLLQGSKRLLLQESPQSMVQKVASSRV